ncbi:unnamed protein product [Lactuca saligna]|uniref:Transposase MuDR plant domain-containing protein n=1 Tax=Lactuca saligna TaxID=75948 RepID=A0AA36E8Y8_LACSI|nr:unnamed protein product [Lactuca saligna]
MDNEVNAPRWDISAHSPVIEQVISEFKFKLKYGGFFRLARNSCRQVYCFGSTKCLYIDTFSYDLNHLLEEVKSHYPSQSDIVLSIVFVDKYAKEQCFIELDNDKSFMVMLNMYNENKEVTIYATTEKLRLTACCGDKECKWRIHASLTQDGVTFEVKKFVEIHSCTRSNKSGNKHAT